MSTIRTRIAPSPTGYLHIGTARAALFNYLFAKKNGGKFILRIEDTDLERSDPKYERDILENLQWLGIEADESPTKDGQYKPYRQSERIASYKKYIEKLLTDGKAFYCFHSASELEEEKVKLLEAKKPPLHLCEFRTLDLKEAETLAETKSDYIIRFKISSDRLIIFRDLIRGELSFESGLIGDFSIAKPGSRNLTVAKDGDHKNSRVSLPGRRSYTPLYNFAVVVDDFEMRISHVIRGEDHISNTPKQLLLMEALNFDKPQYAHLPLILGTDRSKLSKRHGATSVGEYREQGYLPETIFNFMALLGWNPGNDREILTKEELINEFSLEKVQKSGAIFDTKKLDWMNGEYIRNKPLSNLVDLAEPFLERSGLLQFPIFNFQFSKKEYVEKIMALEQPRLKKLSEIGERTDYFFRMPEYDKELLRWKNMSDKELFVSLERSEKIISNFQLSISKDDIEKVFLDEIGEGDKGVFLWPLRVALTGKKASPGPFEIIEILGREKTLKRIQTAKLKLR